MLTKPDIESVLATLRQAEGTTKTLVTLAKQVGNQALIDILQGEPTRIQHSIKVLLDHMEDEKKVVRQLLTDQVLRRDV